jgi:NADPH:quinone reductase-like Zn-dependent oxidoreductase
MRAAIFEKYGPPEVERLAEVATPRPRSGEVLVRVRCSTVNRTDCGHRRAHPFIFRASMGLFRPKAHILGSELSGEVDAVGPGTTQFVSGDRVFGITPDGMGTHAEFVCIPEDAPLAMMPADTSFEAAAAVCIGAIQALTCLRAAGVREGQRILVYGASGSVGTAGVQLAKHLGAHVTAVCPTKGLDVVRSLGVDKVIDFTREDFTKNGATYDVIFDAVGKHSFRRCWGSLVGNGVFVVADLGFLWQNPVLALLTSFIGSKRVKLPFDRDADTKKDVELLKGLIETGRYRAVIDRIYALHQVVEATAYVETGQKVGNVVLTVSPDLPTPPSSDRMGNYRR